MLLLFSIFLHVHVCLFFQAQELPTLFRSIPIPSKTFSSQADNSFFFSSQESAFYTPWHFNIFLSYSATTLSAKQLTNSIFKTQRKSSVTYLNILNSTAPGLTDFPLLLNHDLVYVILFYSPLFCSINFLAIVSIPTLKR